MLVSIRVAPVSETERQLIISLQAKTHLQVTHAKNNINKLTC